MDANGYSAAWVAIVISLAGTVASLVYTWAVMQSRVTSQADALKSIRERLKQIDDDLDRYNEIRAEHGATLKALQHQLQRMESLLDRIVAKIAAP